MTELIDLRLLITICLEQAQIAQRLAPDGLPLELLDRTAAAISCLPPRLPNAVLEMAMNEVADQLQWATV